MALFDGCLLVSDVDGTLVGGTDPIAPYNVEKINYFVDNGGLFTLATGRCADACRELVENLGIRLSAPAAVVNGTVIYDYSNNRVVASTGLDDESRAAIVRISKTENALLGIEIHSRDKVIDARVTHEIDLHNLYEDLHPILLDCEAALSCEWNKVLFSFEPGYTREELRDVLISEGVAPDQIMFTNAYLDDGIHDYLEVVPKDADKGTGIKMLADKLGIDIKNVYGIGDFYNDIPMLRTVGHPIVVAGAPKEIEQLAEFVSLSVTEGAIGRLVEYIEERIKANEN